MKLISTNPAWFILFCVLAGLLFAGLLYYRNKDGYSPLQRYVMMVLRFLSVFFISFLLLSWVLKVERSRTQKPLVLLLHDNSESIRLAGADDAEWKKNWLDLESELSSKYNVEYYTFGENLKPDADLDFSEKQTNMAAALDQLRLQYAGQNLSGIVMASDGIYTAGAHPVQVAARLNTAVYTVGLGDTTVPTDLLIQRVNHNKYTYLNNQFPVEVDLKASKLQNTKAVLTIESKQKKLFEKEIFIDKESFYEKVSLNLKAEAVGLQHYVVKITSGEAESSLQNNVQDIYIEVLDNRRKVLLLAAAPHPDLTALRQSIGNNDRYEVDFFIDRLPEKALDAYDLVILHQLPSTQNSTFHALVQNVQKQNLSVFFILGALTDINLFNQLDLALHIDPKGGQTTEAFPSINELFTYFQSSEAFKKGLFDLPPLTVPFGNYSIAGNAQTFLFQKILGVTTDMPLLLFSQNAGSRQAILVGDGLWRWRLNDFMRNQNHEQIDEFIFKIVQFLSAGTDKRPFRLDVKSVYNEIEPIEIDAELYNESYELVNNADVHINIKNEDGLVYPFSFSPTATAYSLNAGLLPVGDYIYEASARLGQKDYQAKGTFTVSRMNMESLNLQADHHLLYTLSQETGAEMYNPSDLNQLVDDLKKREDGKPIAYVEKDYYELINLKWIAFVILTLLSLEWFLRRYFGSY